MRGCKRTCLSASQSLTEKTFDKHAERNDMPLIVDFWGALVWAVPHDGADLRQGGEGA